MAVTSSCVCVVFGEIYRIVGWQEEVLSSTCTAFVASTLIFLLECGAQFRRRASRFHDRVTIGHGRRETFWTTVTYIFYITRATTYGIIRACATLEEHGILTARVAMLVPFTIASIESVVMFLVKSTAYKFDTRSFDYFVYCVVKSAVFLIIPVYEAFLLERLFEKSSLEMQSCTLYWSEVQVIQKPFDIDVHPWLIDGGYFYVNERVKKNHTCHDYIANQFIAADRTVTFWMTHYGRRLQSWDGSVGQWRPQIRDQTMRCRNCSACRAPRCGTCVACLDHPRYGGPGIRKQRCKKQICNRPLLPLKSTFMTHREFHILMQMGASDEWRKPRYELPVDWYSQALME